MAVNYGLNKVRFPAPVPAGSRVRLSATLASAEEVSGGGIQASIDSVMQPRGCRQARLHRTDGAPLLPVTYDPAVTVAMTEAGGEHAARFRGIDCPGDHSRLLRTRKARN